MKVYSSDYLIRYSECDRGSRLKLKSFLDYAQEIAGLHAATFEVDTLQLHQQQRCWLLSRVKMRVHSYPEIGETLRLTTYPAGFDRLFAVRETHFEVAESGRPIADCTGLWLLADTARGRILSAERELGALMPDNSDLPVTFREIGKIMVPGDLAPAMQCTRRIQETQIDLNNHLNNAEYATLVQDMLACGEHPVELQINYQKAVPPESVLTISLFRQEKQAWVIGKFEDTGVTAFECQMLF